MRIYTSSWFVNLPPTIQRIGVSRGTPRDCSPGFRKMMELAPGPWFRSASVPDYKSLYFAQLRALDPEKIVRRIEELSGGKDAALLCYEAPTDNQYCHRAYISCWLHDRLGLEIFEYGHESEGCGWQHPKLPARYRQMPQSLLARLDITPYLEAEATDSRGRTWRVIGTDPDHPDQAVIEHQGTRFSISETVLRQRFQPRA